MDESLLREIALSLDVNGYARLNGVISRDDVKVFQDAARTVEKIESQKIEKGLRNNDIDFKLYKFSGSHFYNPSRQYRYFDQLLGHPDVIQVLEFLFRTKAILSQTELRNPAPNLTDSYAFKWHRDARQMTEDPCWVIVFWVLNDIDLDCGPTEIIEKTHKISYVGANAERIPAENAVVTTITAQAGDAIFLNSNTLHRGTVKRSTRDRWLFIPTYSPWFLKPSMDYTKCFRKSEFDRLTDLQKQIFGFTTTVPHDETKRVYTMRPWQDVVHEFTFLEENRV